MGMCLSSTEPVSGSFESAQRKGQTQATQNGTRSKAPHNGASNVPVPSPPAETSNTEMPPDLMPIVEELQNQDALLAQNWVRYFGPADYKVFAEILKTRKEMRLNMDKFKEGGGNPNHPMVVKIFERCDITEKKLQAITSTMEAEIDRLEKRGLEAKERWELNEYGDPTFTELLRSEIGDLTVEVKMYRKRWELALDPPLQKRLMEVEEQIEKTNTEVAESHVEGHFPHNTADDLLVEHKSLRFGLRSRKSLAIRSMDLDTDAGARSSSGYLTRRQPTLQILAEMVAAGGSMQFQNAMLEAAEQQAQQLQQTEKMLQEQRQQQQQQQEQNFNARQPPQLAPLPQQLETAQNSTSLRIVPQTSFSATLYQTMHKRDGDVPDVGSHLKHSRVRGDGRCLFRSVAKGDAFLRNGLKDWNETKERTMADKLRAKTVEEMRKHKELLVNFYVIDGDFDRYCQRMSEPRTFGGEPELLMLALILHTPISVYLFHRPQFSQIQVYGRQYTSDPINILYSDGIHYDCLLPT